MKRSIHTQTTLLTGAGGINSDVTPDLYSTLKGKAYNFKNVRLDKRRLGEVRSIGNDKYSYSLSVDGMVIDFGKCVAATRIGDYAIGLWNITQERASETYPDYGYGVITVDGTIVLLSSSVYFTPNKTRVDVNHSAEELFVTDGVNIPLILNVGDMLDSVATQKYFSEFTPERYGPRFDSNLGKVMFVGLDEVGTGAGVKVGSYIYFYRLVDQDGNRTGWSPASPTINVVANEDLQQYEVGGSSDRYGWKTYGGVAGTVSKYGTHLRFRVVNNSGFSYVEMGRLCYQSGGPLGDKSSMSVTPIITDYNGTPIDIKVTTNIVIDFVDVSYLVWENSADSMTSQLSSIKSADTLRYFADRLMYFGVTYADYDLADDFSVLTTSSVGSGSIHAITKNMGRIGHRSVLNQAYYKSYMHNERRNFAIVFHDGQGGTTPPIEKSALTNFRFPCQREEALEQSLFGSALVDEMYDPADMIGARLDSNAVGYCFPAWSDKDTQVKNNFSITSLAESVYYPVQPVNRFDANVAGRTTTPLYSVYPHYPSSEFTPSTIMSGFNPKFLSLGVLVAGLNVDSIPEWVKGFSIVQSESNGYVVAQGIGTYDLENLYDTSISVEVAQKNTKGLIVHFPDLDERIGVSPSVLEDIINNPSSYYVQLVAPVGFFSEGFIPSATISPIHEGSERDLITHATVSRAENANPTDTASVIGDGTSGHVLFGKYRDASLTNPITLGTTPEEDVRYQVTSAQRVTINKKDNDGSNINMGTSRSSLLRLRVDTDIYATESFTYSHDAEDSREFHEPFYVVNIVRIGAKTTSGNVQKYSSTGHYQKLFSEVVVGTGARMDVMLVDERYSDYVYVNNKLWISYDYDTESVNAGVAALTLNNGGILTDDYGNQVFGVVRYKKIDGYYHLVFEDSWAGAYSDAYILPAVGDVVDIRYNRNEPSLIFGGEYVVSENYSAILDLSFNLTNYGGSGEKAVKNIGCGFPYDTMKLDLVVGAQTFAKFVQQWVVESILLTKVNTPLITNDAYPNRGYMVKPLRATGDTTISPFISEQDYVGLAEALSLDQQWLIDYADELANLNYGGFTLPQAVNIDYSKRISVNYATLPSVGFTPKLYLPHRVVWSLRRNASTQDAPNIKTFLSLSVWDINDKQGTITRAFDTRSSNGYDLFVFAEQGICRLITNRQLISTIDGNALGIPSTGTNFIQAEDWVNKSVGIPNKFARLSVEGDERLWFVGDSDVYAFGGEGLQAVGDGYLKFLTPWIEAMLADSGSYRMSAAIQGKYDEVIFLYNDTAYVFNYNKNIKSWEGTRTYEYLDNILNDSKLGLFLGYGGTEVYELDVPDSESSPTVYKDVEMEFISADAPAIDKEFVDIEITADVRPDSMEFRTDVDGSAEAIVSSAYPVTNPITVNDLYMKEYGKAWWTYIPRKLSGDRDRVQGNYLVVKIKHNTENDAIRVKLVDIGWKPIK
jgi:hypothetical protein